MTILNERSFATNPLATATSAGCFINEEWIGRTVVISATGALDMLTSPQLESSITTSLRKNPSAMIIELSAVDFLASAGMGVLVAARDQTNGTVRFGVVADGPATSRPLRLVGLADMIGLYPTLAAARDALGA